MAKHKNAPVVNEGQTFGGIRAMKLVDTSSLASEFPDRSNRIWICECDCGGHVIARARDLLSGRVHHCNRCAASRYDEPALRDLTGGRFGRLSVLKMMPPEVRGYPGNFWRPSYYVQCDCGRRFITGERTLASGYRVACDKCDPKK